MRRVCFMMDYDSAGDYRRHEACFSSASQTQTYTYDGDGLRRGKVVGAIRTTFVWDGSDYLMEY